MKMIATTTARNSIRRRSYSCAGAAAGSGSTRGSARPGRRRGSAGPNAIWRPLPDRAVHCSPAASTTPDGARAVLATPRVPSATCGRRRRRTRPRSRRDAGSRPERPRRRRGSTTTATMAPSDDLIGGHASSSRRRRSGRPRLHDQRKSFLADDANAVAGGDADAAADLAVHSSPAA